jgi:hypothetical protein
MSNIDICRKATYNGFMSWTVTITRKCEKGQRDLPKVVRETLAALVEEIKLLGPVRGSWKGYGKLEPKRENKHHCHLKGGQPTYVACWRVVGPNQVEVYYAGTHENAPY